MNKPILTIAIILLVIVGGGIYLNTLDKEEIKGKLDNIFQKEEPEEPQGVTIKEIVSGDNI